LLEIKQVEGGTQITLPLKGLDFMQDYYIVWELKDMGCEPWANATLLPCDEKSNQPNVIQLEVNEKGLSADILLLNQTTSERFEFSMSHAQATISDLPEGQYELFVTYGDMVLIDKVFQFTSCKLLNSGLSPQFNQNNLVDPTIVVNQEQGIRAYPNPVKEQNEVTFHFWGFEEREFAIQISDLKGSVIHNHTFQCSSTSSEFTYEFPTRGTYNVTFSSNAYVEVKRIIVQ
jgi:hypothetical protein